MCGSSLLANYEHIFLYVSIVISQVFFVNFLHTLLVMKPEHFLVDYKDCYKNFDTAMLGLFELSSLT